MSTARPFNEETEQLILENSPDVTEASLLGWMNGGISRATLASRLGRALNRSTHITKLNFRLSLLDVNDDWTLLLRFCEQNETLMDVDINGEDFDSHQERLLLGQTLRALGRNQSIRIVYLRSCLIYVEDFAALVETSSMEDFGLNETDFVELAQMPTQPQQAEQRVAAAFSANTRLSTFRLGALPLENFFTSSSISESLSHHSTLRCVDLAYIGAGGVQSSTAAAVGAFFRASSSNLTVVNFAGPGWTAETFKPVAAGLQGSTNISLIDIHCFDFDEALIGVIASVFQQSETTPKTLVLNGSVTFQGDCIPRLGNVLGSGLPALHVLDLRHIFADRDGDTMFVATINALKQTSCSIQSIKFPNLSPTRCKMLLEALPSFRGLRSIEFSLVADCEHFKGRLLQAFRCNGSLTHICVRAPFITEHDRPLLLLCVRRNGHLPKMITSEPGNNPGQVPLSLWPRMLEMSWEPAVATGPSDALRALIMLGDRVGNTNNSSDDDDDDESTQAEDEHHAPPRKKQKIQK